ncbi:uncharacterized protein C8Q71DRAFT_853635 [Rhodofomes roseus]|uniref:EH domain-containing protein n=1 Tax=Rhodofomes roseus TaxID=34475 RepID=A0ABQ8KXX3_9APHY|nr:uncharacterized protein C8Q71DRAFT_853635 [Rhodofomes roseus]KAH9843145.1 hypothetical protein C8Q71DRAFT_853635 [Rhodofomes roseus]
MGARHAARLGDARWTPADSWGGGEAAAGERQTPATDMSDVHARISAFEALASSPAARSHTRPLSPDAAARFDPIVHSPSPSPPALGRKTSLIDLHDWVLDDGPRNSPPTPALPARPRSTAPVASPRHVAAPLIHLESPPSARPAPPLPPRTPSYTSLRSVSASSASTSAAASRSPPAPPPRRPPPSRASLSADHSYPPALSLGLAIPASPSRHAPASSISSFHSVSLSSDGGDPGSPSTPSNVAPSPSDTVSMAESFEHLSVCSTAPELPRRPPSEPPKLPQRPPSVSPNVTPKSLGSSPRPPSAKPSPPPRAATTKPPPPPPPRPPSSRASTGSSASGTSTSLSFSDRASVFSLSTSPSSSSSHLGPSSSSLATLKPTTKSATVPSPLPSPILSQLTRAAPVPPAARRRYETLFARNLYAQNAVRKDIASPPPGARARKAAGWRGLSVDLLTNPEPAATEQESEERLDGETVRKIWVRSKLERRTLKAIWSDCDPAGMGSLDLEGFVRGTWRIDEELRRAQLRDGLGLGLGLSLGRHGSSASATARGRARASRGNTRLILR